MKIQIFDVEHGGCALLTADTGKRILIDAGHNGTTNWRPSTYLKRMGVSHIEKLIITNFDEDHASDLHNVLEQVSVGVYQRNPSVGADGIKKLKRQSGMGPGIEAVVGMEKRYTSPVTVEPDFGALTIQSFYNRYPEFEDENNLSMCPVANRVGIC